MSLSLRHLFFFLYSFYCEMHFISKNHKLWNRSSKLPNNLRIYDVPIAVKYILFAGNSILQFLGSKNIQILRIQQNMVFSVHLCESANKQHNFSHFDTFFKEILESMDLKTHKIDMFYMESTTNSSFIFTVNNL